LQFDILQRGPGCAGDRMKLDHLKRREFITLLGGAAAVWPFAGHAQQAMPVIGVLHAGAPEVNANNVRAFRKGLGEAGYVEGRNVSIEFRWAYGDLARYKELAAELVQRQVAIIVTPVSTAAALAAKATTTIIPIVFSSGIDPVQAGLVPSLSRPGGNLTGVNWMQSELVAKRLGLLHEMVPLASRFALLVNPTNSSAESTTKDVGTAAGARGRQVDVVKAATARDIETAFGKIIQNRADALIVAPDPLFFDRIVLIATLAVRHALPAISGPREFVEAGGLMSYGANNLERYRHVGTYAGRILKGEKPADMPVIQPTKFELVLNLPTARMIGVAVPPSLLAQADEVIE
jgi:putative tryptophan/tyrosine transport system substrate-binding protein